MATQNETFNDRELLSALLNNTSLNAGLRFMYREYFSFLSRYIYTNSGNEQDAEDNFQEVMVAFVNLVKAGKFRGEASIKTFLFSLNKNIWLNELKRRGRALVREVKYDRLNEQPQLTPDIVMEVQQSKNTLLKALNELGENCRKILLLYYFENKSMKEIVSALPYQNEQVVRNKKSKCLKRLTQIVSGNKTLYNELKNFLDG